MIVLSATGLESRKVAALDGGANDYVTKPFGMAELEATIRTAVRAGRFDSTGRDSQLVVGELDRDHLNHRAQRAGETIELTAREFYLLAYLASHAGKLCTHRMILEHVWGENQCVTAQVIRAQRCGVTHRGLLVTRGGVCPAVRERHLDNDLDDLRGTRQARQSANMCIGGRGLGQGCR